MGSRMKVAILSAALAAFLLPAAAQVNQRQVNQQRRIHQGVKSGQLTPGETRHLERKEVRLHREVKTMRRTNGGRLTPHERARVNRQQNHLSRQIYRDKHNSRTR